MIGVSDMENEVIRKLLRKVFKHLELEKNDADKFSKPYDMDELLVPKIKDIINEEAEEKAKMAQELLGEKVSDDEKKLNNPKDRKNNRMQLDKLPEVIHKRPVRPPNFEEDHKVGIYGPQRPDITPGSIAGKKIMKGVSSSLANKISRDSEGEDDELSMLMKRAAGQDYESNKRQKMRRVIGPSRKMILNDKEINDKDSALEHEQMKAYFDEYDRKHRPKSLLEIHQERKKMSKVDEYGPGRSFNNSDELFTTRIDSKSVFKMMGNAGDRLNKRFSSAKFKNSFM